MEQMTFGGTDLRVTRVAFGAWAIGGWLWGGADETAAVQAIHEALDMGVNVIDTAAVYGFGRSEELVAKALATSKVPRDEIVIATKFGMDWDDEGQVTHNGAPQRVRQEVEDSLRRLGTDYIDIYQLHWPDPNTPVEETAAAVARLFDEGKIRAVGVCNYTPEQMERWQAVAPLHSNQVRFNLLERDAENDVLPYVKQHGMSFMAYSPLARGMLTGKYEADATFPSGDTRGSDPRFTGEGGARNARIVGELNKMSKDMGKTTAQLSMRWVLDRDPHILALWGARRPGQIAEAAGLDGWTLTKEEMARIDAIVARESS